LFYSVVRYVCNAIIHVIFKIRLKYIDKFPMDGAVIVYSNHKSNWDPIIIGCLLKRPVFFMAKEELFRNPIMRFIVTKLHAFPVKRGAPDRKAIKRAIEVLNEKQVLGIFPEGTRSKDGKLQEPESGIALIAAKSNDVTLVPVAINGNYKWLSSIDVIFGEPIKFDTYFQKGEKMNSQKLKNISIALFREVSKLMPS
jgi:1-acyl-sn-glycerol-3-phosphate acyltransferase